MRLDRARKDSISILSLLGGTWRSEPRFSDSSDSTDSKRVTREAGVDSLTGGDGPDEYALPLKNRNGGMTHEWSRRLMLQAVGSTLTVALAGCSTLSITSYPEGDSTLGTTDYDPIIPGQPTIDDGVPAVWGIIFSHPDAARKLIDWDALTAEGGIEPGVEYRTFDPNTQFMTVIVGVLQTGYGLAGYTEESETIIDEFVEDFSNNHPYDDGVLRYEVTTYRAFSPEPTNPDYHYDYTFTLWNLNGHDEPDEVIINFHTP